MYDNVELPLFSQCGFLLLFPPHSNLFFFFFFGKIFSVIVSRMYSPIVPVLVIILVLLESPHLNTASFYCFLQRGSTPASLFFSVNHIRTPSFYLKALVYLFFILLLSRISLHFIITFQYSFPSFLQYFTPSGFSFYHFITIRRVQTHYTLLLPLSHVASCPYTHTLLFIYLISQIHS